MPEVKSIQDFYDPTRAMNAYVGMQQVGLHQQQIAQQAQSIANQGRNLQVDNAKQAFAVTVKENPLAAVSAWNNFAELSGLPKMDNPNAFLANPQPYLDLAQNEPDTPQYQAASQAIAGMGESQSAASRKEAERRLALGGGRQLSQAVGAGSGAEAATAMLSSPQGQTKAYESLIAQAQQAGMNAQLNGLVPINSQAQRGLQNLQPHTEALANLTQQRQQWTAKYGETGAKQKFDEAVKLNPDLVKYQQQAQASVPQLEQQLQALQQKSDALNTDRILMATGAKPKGPEESPYVMTHQLQAAGFHERYLQAQLELAKDPLNVTKHAEVARASLDLNSHVQGLINGAITPEQVKADTLNATNMGRQQFAALPTVQQNPQQAARIVSDVLAKTGKIISTEDVMQGAKLPNQPLVNLNQKIDTKVGEGLAKGVEPIVSASQTAALGAIDTVDTVQRAQAAIAKGMVNVGPTATIRQKVGQVAQLLGVGGTETEEQLVNTRTLIRSLGQFSLAARKQLKGQGQVSDFEGKLLIKAESGEIEDMTIPELKSFLKVTDRLARKQYSLHQHNMKNMRSNPELSGLAPFYDVPPLPDTQDIQSILSPSAGTVENGYRFKGGDPKSKENWEKVQP